MKIKLYYIVLILIAITSACKKESTTPGPMPYAVFSIGSQKADYHSYRNFSLNTCASVAYCGDFYYDSDAQDMDAIRFTFRTPVAGETIHRGDSGFEVSYLDHKGNHYALGNGEFTLSISTWEGESGWVKANFSGWLRATTTDSIQIGGGYFQGKVQSRSGK